MRRVVGMADYRWALHFHSVAIATQPVHRLQIRATDCSAQLGDIPYHSPKLHPGPCNSVDMRPRTDTQTDTHTDTQTRVIDHNTFSVVYDLRKM